MFSFKFSSYAYWLYDLLSLSFLLSKVVTITISTLQCCFEAYVTSVHKEPCTQLVLNSGSYAQSLYADPTEGGSVCTGKLQSAPTQALHSWVG